MKILQIKPIESQDIEYCIEENIDEVSLIVNTKNNDYKNLRLEIFGINYNLLRLDVWEFGLLTNFIGYIISKNFKFLLLLFT